MELNALNTNIGEITNGQNILNTQGYSSIDEFIQGLFLAHLLIFVYQAIQFLRTYLKTEQNTKIEDIRHVQKSENYQISHPIKVKQPLDNDDLISNEASTRSQSMSPKRLVKNPEVQNEIQQIKVEPRKQSKRMKIKQDLYQWFMNEYENRQQQEIILQNKAKNQELRKQIYPQEQGLPEQIMMEMDAMGVTPQQIYYQFENIHIEQIKWNHHCKKCDIIKREDDVDIIFTEMKLPFPLSNRVFVDARYLWSYQDKNEFIAIFSSQGNEDVFEEFLSKERLGSRAKGKALISGHMLKPIYDQDSKQVIGTKIFYVNCCEFGGSIPPWITNSFAPKAVQETFDQIIKAAKKVQI